MHDHADSSSNFICRARSASRDVRHGLVSKPIEVTHTVHAQPKLDADALDVLLRVKSRTVQHMALNPLLVRATLRQNLQKLTVDEIKARDVAWRGSKELTPFKRSLQSSGAGTFLKQTVTRLAAISEAFLTDNQGANVAAYPATSDYWQGDEEKWSASFNAAKGKVFIGKLELDESTQIHAIQISAPVIERGKTIGVLVVGVTLNYVEAK
ncbi:MAG: hypothetical protein ACI8W7_000470 [Gammaproteobacteria bacterium]